MPLSVSRACPPCSSETRRAAIAKAMARLRQGSTRTIMSAELRVPAKRRLAWSRVARVRAEWAMKCNFCRLARLARLRPRIRMTSAIPQAKRKSPGIGSGLAVSSKGPSSRMSRRLDNMAVRREIERASQQPLDYGAKGKLLGVVVRKVRDALLKLCHEGID